MSCCEREHSPRPLSASMTATLTSPLVKRWPYTLSSEVGLIDTHCHLDFLFRKTGHRGSYAQFRIRNQANIPILLRGMRVWGAFGCHPHMARHYDEDVEEDLIAALEQRSVVALGEIGLDYSAKNKCDRMMQQRVFRRQLQLARNGRLPLVIHSRDSSNDTLRILKEMVPGDWPIHRHCFTGDWSEAQLWMDTFPNLCLGLTPLVGFPNAGPVAEVGRRIPLERLLLETDAPYFLPKSESGRLAQSHPGMAIHVATWLSNVRKIPVQDILEAVRENTREIYRI
ncbi:hypothetical protein HPB49_019552 [Dermacentor silvarum]|uniref:Uncharacterized protein n=1 Tax=Dermacentor silvarum TaxID=543639 RepID=A0ACB8CAX5_DERSI|nr:hypothetical protein HPB49_019552 [Dermacentor silvarum]